MCKFYFRSVLTIIIIILSGMTLVTPAVKVTDLIQPVRDLFPGRDFGTAENE